VVDGVEAIVLGGAGVGSVVVDAMVVGAGLVVGDVVLALTVSGTEVGTEPDPLPVVVGPAPGDESAPQAEMKRARPTPSATARLMEFLSESA
jgi:hypothetical protein